MKKNMGNDDATRSRMERLGKVKTKKQGKANKVSTEKAGR